MSAGRGYTAFAGDLEGVASVRIDDAGHARLGVEAGDLLVRYGLNPVRPGGQTIDGFVSDNLLVSAGLGWRF